MTLSIHFILADEGWRRRRGGGKQRQIVADTLRKDLRKILRWTDKDRLSLFLSPSFLFSPVETTFFPLTQEKEMLILAPKRQFFLLLLLLFLSLPLPFAFNSSVLRTEFSQLKYVQD